LNIMQLKAQTTLTQNVATAGTLSTLLGNKVDVVKSLTLTGTINGTDIITIRTMDSLTVLNLKNVRIAAWGLYYYESCYTEDNKITNYMFYGCSRLTSIILPTTVTSIGDYVFDGCTSLTSVTIPTSVTFIGRRAFGGCSSLATITIPNNITSIGYGAFDGCSALTSVLIPTKVTSIGEYTFNGCSALSSATIPVSVKSIGRSAFDGCSGLSSISIPSAVTSIGVCAFYGCSGLTSVTIPNSVTSIGESSFSCCTGLTSVTIGSKVASVGAYSFYGCTGLTEIHCKEVTAPTITTDVFDLVDKTTCKLYIPLGSYASYAVAAGWLDFSNIIEEEPSAVDDINTDLVLVFTNDGMIHVRTKESMPVSVYTLSGQRVFERTIFDDAQIPLNEGVYIVNAGGQMTKVILK
jgi:hypothetical protein